MVAPKEGLYTAEKLQEFIMTLVPEGLELTSKRDFKQPDRRSYLQFGELYFDEALGKEEVTRICTVTDTNYLSRFPELVNGQMLIEKSIDYTRNIWVCHFPCEDLMMDILVKKTDFVYSIPPRELRRYETGPGPLEKLMMMFRP